MCGFSVEAAADVACARPKNPTGTPRPVYAHVPVTRYATLRIKTPTTTTRSSRTEVVLAEAPSSTCCRGRRCARPRAVPDDRAIDSPVRRCNRRAPVLFVVDERADGFFRTEIRVPDVYPVAGDWEHDRNDVTNFDVRREFFPTIFDRPCRLARFVAANRIGCNVA